MEKEMLKVILDLCERYTAESRVADKTEYTQGFFDGVWSVCNTMVVYIKTTLAETDV